MWVVEMHPHKMWTDAVGIQPIFGVLYNVHAATFHSPPT